MNALPITDRTGSVCKKRIVNIISLVGMASCVVLGILAWQKGILTSQSAMQEFVNSTGVFGPLVFVILQIVQVVVPIIPGGISCLVGVLLFGPVMGFVYNYVGICIGSMFAFFLSKHYGRSVMEAMFKQETIRKYEEWMNRKNRFSKLLAILLLIPVAPDDLLCYLAGITSMSWKRFTTILWLCKPSAIIAYSLLLKFFYVKGINMLGGHWV